MEEKYFLDPDGETVYVMDSDGGCSFMESDDLRSPCMKEWIPGDAREITLDKALKAIDRNDIEF